MSEFSVKNHQKETPTNIQSNIETEEITQDKSWLPTLGHTVSGTPPPLSNTRILQLQGLIGNQAVQRLINQQRTVIQRQVGDDDDEASSAPRSVPSIVQSYCPPQDERPLAQRLSAAQSDSQALTILLYIFFHESNTDMSNLDALQSLILSASMQDRSNVIDDPDVINVARRRLAEDDFHTFEGWLMAGPGAPVHLPPSDERPLTEQLDELLEMGSLSGLISVAIGNGAEWAVIRPYIERANDTLRSQALHDRSLMDRAREHFSEEDFQALSEALRAPHGPSEAIAPRHVAWLWESRLPLYRRLTRALVDWRATFMDVREIIEATTPEARHQAWTNDAFREVARRLLSSADYEDLLVALGTGTRTADSEDGVNLDVAQVDEDIRSHLGTYVAEAVRDGLTIEDHVAFLEGPDWRRVVQTHFPDEWETKEIILAGFYSEGSRQVFIRRDGASLATLIHEALHLYSRGAPGFPEPLEEGTTQYFTFRVIPRPEDMRVSYQEYLEMVRDIVRNLGADGEQILASAYFDADINRLRGEFERVYGSGTWTRFIQLLEAEGAHGMSEAYEMVRNPISSGTVPVRVPASTSAPVRIPYRRE